MAMTMTMIHIDDKCLCSEDTKPLLLGFLGRVLFNRLRGQLAAHGGGLKLLLGLGRVLAEDGGDGVLGLDVVHLHEVAAFGHVVDVAGAVVLSLGGLVLFVLDDDVLPGVEEVDGLVPEVGDGRHEVLEGGVVGVVHEEGGDAEEEEGALLLVGWLANAVLLIGLAVKGGANKVECEALGGVIPL